MAAVCETFIRFQNIRTNKFCEKTTIGNIHNYLVKQQLTLEKVRLQVLIDNLVEENNMETYKSNSNEIC